MYTTLDFIVTICLGGGDGGDVSVSVDVTEDEYNLLKECYRADDDIDSYDGLEELCDRIKTAAQDENDICMLEGDLDEELDYDSVSYIIEMPDEIMDAVDEEG